jgi:hypothetical protein
VRKQRSAAVEEQAAVHDHRPVVTVGGESGTRAEESKR